MSSAIRSLCALALIFGAQGFAEAARPDLEDVDTPEMLEAEAEARLDWSHFRTFDKNSTVELDSTAYRRIFDEYGDHGPHAALDFLYMSRRGLGHLASFSSALQRVPVSTLNRDEQLAYWLNLHNTQGILKTTLAFPVQDENSKVVILGPAWTEPSLTVEGFALSLRDIELRILLRQWPDPLVLYGLYFPASGAPAGPTEPFRGKDVWRQLEERARQFVNHGPSHQFVRDQVHVSAFYYLADKLWADEAQLLAHLVKYSSPNLAKTLSRFSSIEATWLNWRLNSFSSGYDVNQDRAGGGS